MPPPKYLTGDKQGIQDFLNQFDSRLQQEARRHGGTKHRRKVFSLLASLSVATWRETFAYRSETSLLQDDVFGSSYSASIYISRILCLQPPRNKVFVMGESGIEAELRSESIPYIGGTDPSLRRDITPEDFTKIATGEVLDPDVGVVLVGLDYHMNYLKLSLGFAYIRQGAKFLATNTDSTLPSAGSLFPGAGSISAPLAKMLGREPLALGKPSQAMMDAIEGKFKLDRGRTCMVGDRLDTDIRFGIEGKLGGTLAVLTGVSKKDDMETKDAEMLPAAYVDKLGDLRL
ncbi:MAG: hypothetical protein M1836_003585 [Candelina mexicana]|nr:MAG: hypothetical protein M1836_003585 [Candelina mexicana]